MRVIYNCKKCKIGLSVEYPQRTDRNTLYRVDGEKQHSPGIYIIAYGGGKPTEYQGDPLGLCPKCGKIMTWGPVVGRLKADVPCDGRCTGARGHNCECSCGGANHGKDWI